MQFRTLIQGTLLTATLVGSGAALALGSQTQQGEPVVSQERAEQAALEQVQGRVEEADFEGWDGKQVWEIEIEAEDGQDYEVVVDGTTGEVLDVEE